MMIDDLLNCVRTSGAQSQMHVSDSQCHRTLGVKRANASNSSVKWILK